MPGKTDFLRINAFAIKDMIKRKLAQDTRFTDQIYEGSNLAVLIDIFSYMAQTLLYQLNNAASESMFSDTMMYENMNRLCNFIGYDPKGSAPSIITATIPSDELERFRRDANRSLAERAAEAGVTLTEKDYEDVEIVLCKYSFVKTGKSDSLGKEICYSVGNEDQIPSMTFTNGEQSFKTVMYNGLWKAYPTVFVSTGDPWETFTLETLKSDSDEDEYIAHGFMDVYAVKYRDDNPDGEIEQVYKFSYTDRQLFKLPVENKTFFGEEGTELAMSPDEANKLIYQGYLKEGVGKSSRATNQVFNLKLNEDKQYQITFGDGTTGAIPPKGSSIIVVYLETNGPRGEVEVGDIDRQSIIPNQLGMSDTLANWIFFGTPEADTSKVFYGGKISNTSPSTIARKEEGVEEIRRSAPNWFKMGNRLVTKDDYEYYLMNSAFTAGFFSDVRAMNNWEYVSTFYRWLYDLGTRFFGDPRHYLNQNRLVKNDFETADPADCNNIYLWVCRGSDAISSEDDVKAKELNDKIKKILMPIKDMTHEPIILDAVPVYFGICASSVETAQSFVDPLSETIDFNGVSTRSYFEITIDDVAFYASSTIARQVEGKIRDFFREGARHIGGFVNFNDLMLDIMAIDGISRVRTVYVPMNSNNERNTNAPIVVSGLSFASWSGGLDNLIDPGIDMEVSTTGRTLEQFQYPKLADASQLSRAIKVIRKSMTTLQRVQY